MQKRDLERLLRVACDLIAALEVEADAGLHGRIDAFFSEVHYTDYLDAETEDTGPEHDSAGFTEDDRIVNGQYRVVVDPDQEVQDWDAFGEGKI